MDSTRRRLSYAGCGRAAGRSPSALAHRTRSSDDLVDGRRTGVDHVIGPSHRDVERFRRIHLGAAGSRDGDRHVARGQFGGLHVARTGNGDAQPVRLTPPVLTAWTFGADTSTQTGPWLRIDEPGNPNDERETECDEPDPLPFRLARTAASIPFAYESCFLVGPAAPLAAPSLARALSVPLSLGLAGFLPSGGVSPD